MSSPFLDTTEYFMNKIIQRQEIVPPWIEKQQELVSSAARFRGRLRSDWRRHAARVIASIGGGLESQMRRAQDFARAEATCVPRGRHGKERPSSMDDDGHLSQISTAGEIRGSSNGSSHPGTLSPDAVNTITVTEEAPSQSPAVQEQQALHETEVEQLPRATNTQSKTSPGPLFRDPSWESTERSYHQAAVETLNSLTRSYNLMAPDLAKKPYFSLDRELQACYAEVAPTLASEIRDRALAPKPRIGTGSINDAKRGVDGLFGSKKALVADERKGKQYGFREFVRDLWGPGKDRRIS